ncbi:3-hydroxyacyl-CoA dehydrogenase NAD-binding domain-containing protein [Niveispirillum fermenti]|uniref:3-hydroxyacyl-CoA dehydrogenase n=1 Tax=Niveispirillum fermenti TaxID=1233113 RepID=UPI003A89C6F9
MNRSNEVEAYIARAEADAVTIPGLEKVQARPIASTGVIGGGTMGRGIATALLCADFPVTLVERDPAALKRAVDEITSIIERNVATQRMSDEEAARALRHLVTANEIDALGRADLVIEAAYETMAVKRDIFSRLDRTTKEGTILASNTSYLDVLQIASSTSRPQDVLGMHFFSPAHIMKLLEVVRTGITAPDALATAINVGLRIGKKPVVAGNAYGFIGNRMLAIRRREAEAIILKGVTPDRVDRVVENFGFRMGPFRMGDLAGLDLGWTRETSTGSTVRERLCEAGRRGQKTGAGFYDYDEQRKPVVSQEAIDIIAGFAADKGIAPREWSDEAILDRMLLPMIDEAAKILAEGIAARESDIDVVWLYGYNWPRHTGGPMHYARTLGLDTVCTRLRAIDRNPSDALRKLVDAAS